MALDGTALGLVASIAEWLDDGTLAASIPDFIKMAESRLNRLLTAFAQEARADAVMAGEYLALPADCNSVRSIFVIGSPNVVLNQMVPDDMREIYGGYGAQKPIVYALTAAQIQFAPIPNAPYPVEIVYYRNVPPLATNTTNWVLTSHPDCYLYGSLLAAEIHGWNSEKVPLLKAAFDTAIKEINDDSDAMRWSAAPLFPRIRRYA